jgi:hypothetical protein
MRFDSAGQMKLVFKPIRALDETELRQVIAMRDHPDTIKAITMTVSQMDTPDSKPAPLFAPSAPAPLPMPKAAAKPAPKPAPVDVDDGEDAPVEEPKKVAKKGTAPVESAPKADLADIVGDWDD